MFDIGGILVNKCMSLYLFEMYKLQLVLIDVCHSKHYNNHIRVMNDVMSQ